MPPHGAVAQSVEQRTENPCVGGSIPPHTTRDYVYGPFMILKFEKYSRQFFAIRYGKPFVELIAKYIEENGIERPDDFVMKSLVNKSGLKVYIIQQTDKKIPFETIAKSKDMRLDDLLEEIETITASGTKLNLDYAIDQMIDENEQEEVLEYFKSCETSSLQVAQEELSEFEFTWEQLKIMRIKFLSQYGM